MCWHRDSTINIVIIIIILFFIFYIFLLFFLMPSVVKVPEG